MLPSEMPDSVEEISDCLKIVIDLFPQGTLFIQRPDVFGFLAKPPHGPVVLVSIYDPITMQSYEWPTKEKQWVRAPTSH